jgi:hypothetical protein
MKKGRVLEVYEQFVVTPGLERTGLLEALRGRFEREPAVLYPGCFVHVTASFFFQHVVYVDRNEVAAELFDGEGPLQLVNDHKRYAQAPYLRFIRADFTRPLPLVDESMDLLLALYAGGISRSCKRYLRYGGHLLTNDHLGDAAEAAADGELELVAVAEERRGAVRFTEGELSGYLAPRPSSGRPEYQRRADYYLFRRARPRTPPRAR